MPQDYPKKTIELEPGEYHIRLLKDWHEKQTKKGSYWYPVFYQNEKHNLYALEGINFHSIFRGLKENDECIIYVTGNESEGYAYDVGVGQGKTPINENQPAGWEMKTYDIHIQVAAKIAAQSIPEPFDTKLAARRTDQWLHIITDHFGRAVGHLECAENVPMLENIWRKHSKLWMSMLNEAEYNELRTVSVGIKANLVERLAKEETKAETMCPPEEKENVTNQEEDELPF